jgi:hypothetical protein
LNAHGIDLGQDAIRQFCDKWKIRELRVFGSILRDDFRADSDVDFLADFDEDVERDAFDHMDMEDELANIVGRKVDLVSRSAVEASGNRFYIREILGKAELIIEER